MKYLTATLITAALLAGCSAGKNEAGGSETAVVAGWNKDALKPAPAVDKGQRDVAMTRIYKTNGDYADKVPVTLNDSRTALVSFPAPSDLVGAAPVALDGGFLLDRRGVSANTAFTRWTYAEYSALPSAPSAEEIMKNLIPDARVTEIYSMPFATGTPGAVQLCNDAIANGLKGCTLLYPARTLRLE